MDDAERLNTMPPPAHRGLFHGLVAVVGFGVLLTCWSAMTGRYGGPDEPAHVLRAHAVADGDLLGDPAIGLPPGYRTVTVPAGLGTGDPACYRHDPTVTSACADGERNGEMMVSTSAGTNPPTYYALVGLPPRLLGIADDPLAYRLTAAALVAIVLGLVVARLGARGDHAVLAAMLITPSCWFLWGVVNPNSLEIALVALAATGAVYDRSTRVDWWVSVPLAIAVSMRPIAGLWAIVLLVVVELGSRGEMGRRRRLVLWAPPAIAVVGVSIWNSWSGLVIDDERTAGTGSAFAALDDSIGGLPRSGAELVASMGWLEYWAPWLSVLAWGAAVLVVVLARPRPARGTWAVLGGALVLVPVVFEVVLYDRVGLIWQGRYSLPIAAMAIVVAIGTTTRPIPRRLVPAALLLSVAGAITTFWVAARRYAVGNDGSWWFTDAVRTTRWLPPGTWVAVHAVLIAGVGGGLLVTSNRTAGRRGAIEPAGSDDVAEHVDHDVGGA